jgi:hypothetical protein
MMSKFPPKLFLKIILVLLLFTPIFIVRADVSELGISPIIPEKGDTVTFLIKAQPGEEVEVTITFTKKVAVSDREYSWRLDNVYVPSTPNSVSVKATDVEALHVSVKILIWVTKSVMASGGVAEVSQSNVPKGSYDVWLHGDAAIGANEISLQVTAKTIVTIGSDGQYTYNYNTENIPVGTFTVQAGGITKVVTLAPRNTTTPPIGISDSTPPSVTDPIPTGMINSSSPIVAVNYSDLSGVDVDSLRFVFNGDEVAESAIVTSSSMKYIVEELGNGTTNHVEVWISDVYGNEAFFEWDFTVVIPPRDAEIIVTDLSPVSADVFVGQDMVVTVAVSNVGDLEGSYNLSLLLNEELHFEDLVFLSGGESAIFNYTFAGLEVGFYRVELNALSEDFRVTSWAEESNRSVLVNELISVSSEAAAEIVEALPPQVTLDVLRDISTDTVIRIFEKLEFYVVIDIVESAVQIEQTEEVSSVLLGIDEDVSVALLLGVDPILGSELIASLLELDSSACVEKIERAIKADLHKSAEILELVEIDMLSEILLEIVWMPSTPSIVSDLFEVMSADRVFQIFQLWFDQGYLHTINLVLNGLTSSRLEIIIERFLRSERLVLLSYLSPETSKRIGGGLVDFPDLVVQSMNASIVEPMVYSVKVNVGNLGNAVSGPFDVIFSVDGVVVNSSRVEKLPSDESLDVDIIWEPEIFGEYIIETDVDRFDEVVEFDESNNNKQLSYEVDEPPQSNRNYLYIFLLVSALCLIILFRFKIWKYL